MQYPNTPPLDGDTFEVYNKGGWSACGVSITGYHYEWLRSTTVISGATASTYRVTAADLDYGIRAKVSACTLDYGCSAYVASYETLLPADRSPNSPSNLLPANGALTGAAPTLSSTFSDPDSDQEGYVSYSVYRYSDNSFVTSGNGGTVVSGNTSAWTPTLAYGQHYYFTARAEDADTNVSSVVGSAGTTGFYVAPSVPTLTGPSGSIQTVTPVLGASASSVEQPVSYEFRVATDSSCDNTVVDSGLLPATSTWTVPAGNLQDGQSYYWCALAEDTDEADSAWSSGQSFSIHLQHLGVRGYWPIWSHGPLAVNEANGNLIVSLPTPSYPTAIGSLSFSLTYNSQSSTSSAGLGAGWTLVAGDGSMTPPVKLIDHTVVSPTLDAAEVVWPDGSSDYYNQVGSSTTYLPAIVDGSQLTREGSGGSATWTLVDSDGTTYTFGTEASGVSLLQSAETAASASGEGILTYSFNAGEISGLSFQQTPSSSPETLTFNWGSNCAHAGSVFCVIGPDGTTTWSYTGDGDSEITGVYDSGNRQLVQLTYPSVNGNDGLLSKIQNADDLDPTHASPGYNGQHSIQLTYTGNQVSCVLDGPISNQGTVNLPISCGLGSGSVADSIWSFNYAPSCPTLKSSAASHAVAQGIAVGCTTLTDPDQQPNGAGITVLYDNLGRPLEYDDARLGSGNERISLLQYNNQNQLAWSEDADGNPTDYSYDPTSNVLLSVTGPSPGSSQPRPVTSYRYDEQTVGTQTTPGNPLTGLAGSYWTNTTALAGLPAARETDPAPGTNQTGFSFAAGSGWPPSGVAGNTSGFSARWTGEITIPSSGDYTFTTSSYDSSHGVFDGTQLIVDDIDAIENMATPTSPASSLAIHLTAGTHQLRIEYAHSSAGTTGANLTLEWSCADCSPQIGNGTVPVADLTPAWENQTSVVSPAGRISFQHYLHPELAQPDYSLVPGGSFPTVVAHGGGGGQGGTNCAGGAGGAGGAASSGAGVTSYAGGGGGTGYAYCANGADNGGAGGSSAGTGANGNNGQAGCYYTCTAYGGTAPSGGGGGGNAYWSGGGPIGDPGSSPGGGGGAAGASQCCSYYGAGSGADGKVVITPNVGSATPYSMPGAHSYTVPAGVTSLTVQLWGAGGGGGRGYTLGGYYSGNYAETGGGGGGGGAYSTVTASVTAGEVLSITVGAGGGAGANGGCGYTGSGGCDGTSYGPASAGSNGGDSSIEDTTPPMITSYVYDALGRLSKKYMPKANTNATLDPSTGDLSSTPDQNYETDYNYYSDGAGAPIPSACGVGTIANEWGQLQSTAPYNGGTHAIVTVYNSIGLPIAITNGNGTSCLTYDTENRLASQTPFNDQQHPTSYGYDPSGLQLTVTSNNETVTYSYDEAGRLIDTVDASGAEASYSYDPDGNQLTRTAATGLLQSSTNYTTQWQYYANDEAKSELDPAGNTYQYFYDDRGNLRATQYPNGTFSWVDTNPDGWVTDQFNRHNGSNGPITSTTTTPPSDSSPLADFTYTYDADGKKLSQTETFGSTNQTTAYQYDTAGRLAQVTLPNGTCRQYSYDLDSNRTEIDESSTGCAGTFSTTASYLYNPNTTPGIDELTSVNSTNYTYTSDGQAKNTGTATLTWDNWGRLSTATVGTNQITYNYDPTGALMQRTSSSPTTTTNYLLGDLFETNASGTITTSYDDGPAGDLASFNGPPTGTPTYLYYDAHGNLAAEADTSGNLTASHTYDPFGAPIDQPPSNTTTHRFVGRWDKQYDSTSNLILMGARPYDPTTGRFLSVDPIPGGSLNNYDYAGQDPINNYDLSGLLDFNQVNEGGAYAAAYPQADLGFGSGVVSLGAVIATVVVCHETDCLALNVYQAKGGGHARGEKEQTNAAADRAGLNRAGRGALRDEIHKAKRESGMPANANLDNEEIQQLADDLAKNYPKYRR